MNCPTCRRQYDGQNTVCPRCQTDLAELLALATTAKALLARASLLLRVGDPVAAQSALDQAAVLLGPSPDLARQQAVCHLLGGRFPEALAAWFRHSRSPSPS